MWLLGYEPWISAGPAAGFSDAATFEFAACATSFGLGVLPLDRKKIAYSTPKRHVDLLPSGPRDMYPPPPVDGRIKALQRRGVRLRALVPVEPIERKNQVWMRPHERCRGETELSRPPCQRKRTVFRQIERLDRPAGTRRGEEAAMGTGWRRNILGLTRSR